MKVKKSLINKQLLKLLMSILLLLQKMLKDKVKIILLMMIMIVWIVTPISWNKLLLNLTHVWNINARKKRNWMNYKIPQNKKLIQVRWDIYKDPKISCPFISSPINCIYNKILFWGVFPDILKYAIIKSLHKIDDRCEVSNYRP